MNEKSKLKRYNQFVNWKLNESDEIETPVRPDVKPDVEPAPTTTPNPRRERWQTEKPSVNPDPNAEFEGEEGVEDNLEYLHDTLDGSQLMNNILKYDGHEITLPSETGEFEVDGVRNIKKEGNKLVPTSSSEDVIEYLKNPQVQAQAQSQAQRRAQSQAQAQAQRIKESIESQGQGQDQIQGQEQVQIQGEEGEFETQTGKDPEREALEGEKVDVQKIKESRSYRNRFRTKL